MSNLNLKYKTRYGLDWPVEFHDILIDLTLAKKWREEPYCHGKLDDPDLHMLRALRALFTSEQFNLSPWTELHVRDWCMETFCITWGPAASSKSSDYGGLVVCDWLVDPTETFTIMASTTSDMLQLRSFESTLRYFNILKRSPHFLIPGKESKQRLAIINDNDSDDTNTTVKASIKGVAVQRGSADEARSNLQGVHLPYVRLILDELSQMREAAMDARTNLSIGAKDFRLFGLCNPDSINDLAGRFSVPVGGWSSVSEETDRWETQWGSVRHHNGFKSPAVLEKDGAKKYPYLINQKQIDAIIKEHNGNSDAPQIWTMIKGFPPPSGLHSTVLTENTIRCFRMQDPPVWSRDFKVVAGLDPAFTNGGDDAILQIGMVGYDPQGVLSIGFGDTIPLKLEASNPRPMTYQLVDQVIEHQQTYGFLFEDLGVDDSGTQSVADIIEVETGMKVFRVDFGSKASELPVSLANRNPAKTVYADRITEYYFALVEYAQRNQIRGLPADAAHEFCQRRLAENKRPKRLESKKIFKPRIKRSPDHADACACLIGVVREKLGIAPGSSESFPSGPAAPSSSNVDMTALARQYDLDGRDNNYLIPLN